MSRTLQVSHAPTAQASVLAVLMSVAAWGCGGKVASSGRLPATVVARCGDEDISAQALAAVARSRGVAPRDVLPGLLADACLAAGARHRALPSEARVSVDQRAVLARLVLDDLKRAPHVAAPITDDDVAAVRAARWSELDHEEAVKVIHLVLLFPDKGPRDLEQIRQRAEFLRTAVIGAADPNTFRERALAAAAGDSGVRVEVLEPVLQDGRVLGTEDLRYEAAFARAALELRTPGQQSGLVETSFGIHVLQAIAISPAVHVDTEHLRTLVAREVRTKRARIDLDGLLAALRREHPPLLSREADDLLARPSFRGGSAVP